MEFTQKMTFDSIEKKYTAGEIHEYYNVLKGIIQELKVIKADRVYSRKLKEDDKGFFNEIIFTQNVIFVSYQEPTIFC